MNKLKLLPAKFQKTYFLGNESFPNEVSTTTHPSGTHHQNAQLRSPQGIEKQIGFSNFDIQTNGSAFNRLVKINDEDRAAAFTVGTDAPSFATRGSAINFFTNNSWQESTMTRVEDIRTGYTNLNVTNDGKVSLLSHSSRTGGGFDIHLAITDNFGQEWIETNVPTLTPKGVLWNRSVSGGSNGNYLHAIGITAPTGTSTSGVIYDGVDGLLLYFRSPDGGVTWDKVDIKLPELDSNFVTRIGADSYAIDADGDNVAIAIFNDWNDILVYKSTDNGENWTKYVVNDFPLNKYRIDDLYTVDDIPVDENAPNELAIYTSDGSGDVIIDHAGKVHVVYGQMYVLDDVVDSGSSSYYPGTSGIAYWNEDMEQNTHTVIADLVDANQDTIFSVESAQIAFYYNSLTSFPSLAIGDDNSLYLGYSGVQEEFFDGTSDLAYRHIYLSKSADNGSTWSAPYDVINKDVLTDSFEISFTEAVFPSLEREVTNTVNLIYQKDYTPGLYGIGVTEPTQNQTVPTDNFIMYVEIPKNFDIPTTNHDLKPSDLNFYLYPNPTQNEVYLSAGDLTFDNVAVNIYNACGNLVKAISKYRLNDKIDVSNFANGIYFMNIITEKGNAMSKFVK
ncbi:MAG: T9SS type A sorting domain-containing protein [Saprospiraceae bacterium]|nr:T9SS type A sorting domain-containing protein [Saprospiraceae bacterium]